MTKQTKERKAVKQKQCDVYMFNDTLLCPCHTVVQMSHTLLGGGDESI